MRERNDCRCCRGTSLTAVFDLGQQPYANAFLATDQLDQPEQTSPLTLMECANCGHVQLQHVVDAADLYRDYSFMTSSSQRMADHFAELMRVNVGQFVGRGGLVVEVGSNDGTALESITTLGVRRLGVDPAENLCELAKRRGVTAISRFFNEQTAFDIVVDHGPADLIVACNVMGHIDDLDDFCRGVSSLLSNHGALIIEVPDVQRLIDETEFDTIYHEHLSYFGVGAMLTLFSRHKLRVEKVEPVDVHGGSMRITVRRGKENQSLLYPHQPRDWQAFNWRCGTLRNNLQDWLSDQRDRKKTVWGYCAAAKATVLLNYCGIGTEMLPVVVDSTPLKIGRFMPGTHQPILSPVEVLRQMPDSVLVLAVNHFAEITRREAAYVNMGGRIVNPRYLPDGRGPSDDELEML